MSEFDNAVDKIKKALDSNSVPAAERDNWMRTIYEARAERFLSDNNRIWAMGSIFVPISLAAFTLLGTMEGLTPSKYLALAFSSSVLLLFWNLLSDKHRAFQDQSRAWLVALEEKVIGLQNVRQVKVGDYLPWLNVRRARWVLFFVVLATWVALYPTIDWPDNVPTDAGTTPQLQSLPTPVP